MKDRGNYIEIPLEEPLIYKGGVYHSITLKKNIITGRVNKLEYM